MLTDDVISLCNTHKKKKPIRFLVFQLSFRHSETQRVGTYSTQFNVNIASKKDNSQKKMGLFGKERFGTIAVAPNKRDVKWVLPNWASAFPPGAYDSENYDNHLGHESHMHLVVDQGTGPGNSGAVGLYVHYKDENLGKYSFYFSTAAIEEERQRDPSGAALSQRLTMHTALNIPRGDGEVRVGHFAVTSKAALNALVEANPAKNKGTLWVMWSFDDDNVAKTAGNEADCKFVWSIPRFRQKLISPLTSKIFLVNGLNFVVRMDRKRTGVSAAAAAAAASDDQHQQQVERPAYTIFLFSRRSAFPPHNIALLGPTNGKLMQTEERDDMSSRILTVPGDVLAEAVDKIGTLRFELEFRAGGNPLDGAFNSAPAATLSKSDRPAEVPGCSSGTTYKTVVRDDEI